MLENMLRVKFQLYSWADDEVKSLALYWRILRSKLGKTASQAWEEITREVDDTNLDKILELNS